MQRGRWRCARRSSSSSPACASASARAARSGRRRAALGDERRPARARRLRRRPRRPGWRAAAGARGREPERGARARPRARRRRRGDARPGRAQGRRRRAAAREARDRGRRRCVIVAEAGKLVARLGEHWRLPVEVVRFGWPGTRLRLLDAARRRRAPQRRRRRALRQRRGALHPRLRDPRPADLAALAAAVKAIDGRGRARPLPRAGRRGAARRAGRLARATGQAVNCTGWRPVMCGPISSLMTRTCSG